MIPVGEPTKELQVRNSIARLLNSVIGLALCIDSVEDRFSSVLRSEKKLAKTETLKDVRELVPFAIELNQIITEINKANDRLRSIAERCEL